MKLLSTPEAAKRLGLSVRRVQQLVKDGILPAHKLSRDLAINEDDLHLARERNRKVGRPRKEAA